MHSSRLIRVLAAWLLGLMIAIAAAIVTVTLVNTHMFGPHQQVESYLEALRQGEGERALGLLNATVPDANAALLDGPALQRATQGVENIEVGTPQPSGEDRVEVDVTYTIDDTAHTTAFLLEKTGTEWLFFNQWEFVPSTLPALEVSVINQNEATLNGTRVVMPEGRNQFAAFYPTEVEAHYTSEYFAAPAQTAAVTDRQQATVSLNLATAATPALSEAVTAQLKTFLDSCAKQTVFQPANCPFGFETGNRVAGPIAWSITEYPEVSIEPFNGDWVISPLTGTVLLETSLQDLFTGIIEPISVPQEFGFTARLAVTDEGITVTPVVEY
ncbi:hypothetical protein GCM10027404_16840 [Arthrobacter tumbae]|uniref:hypothetical protein n=1 Tax=Arthrobacter tumbae TaxID=163874 RepID=UPI0027DC7837|nr:hypothetical protein [Arthrobacter tumbae]MBM7780733.1 hypothetical protein [Arthrobacter tumbae]